MPRLDVFSRVVAEDGAFPAISETRIERLLAPASPPDALSGRVMSTTDRVMALGEPAGSTIRAAIETRSMLPEQPQPPGLHSTSLDPS